MFSGRRLLLLLIRSSSLAAAHAGLSFQRESCGAEYWIYGHSHRNINAVIGKTQCVSNQLDMCSRESIGIYLYRSRQSQNDYFLTTK